MEIQEAFNKVLCYSQSQSTVNTDKLFEKWAKAKERFINQMNGKLIYESPYNISISLPQKAFEERIDHYLTIVRKISREIAQFLETEREGLIENKTYAEAVIGDQRIPVGMKIGKALHKFFFDYCKPDDLEWIIQELSRIIQENTVTGRICLSVHPLDYLSLSENQHNWRSCHALDGEYRSGNLSYMCDEVTVIAYIKSEEDVELPNFPSDVPWNNKKWRCLFFFDKTRHIIWAGRQYPFTSDSTLEYVNSKLLYPLDYFDKTNKYKRGLSFWSYQTFKNFVPDFSNGATTYVLQEPYLFWDKHLYPLSNFIQENKYNCAYNDLLNSNYYTPAFLEYGPTNFANMSIPPIEIGGDAPCIHCGTNHIYDSSTMLCADDVLTYSDEAVEGVGICSHCGGRFFEQDGGFYHGELYCANCYEDLDIHICPHCSEEFAAADCCYYDEKTDTMYCSKRCYEKETSREYTTLWQF